MFYEQVKVEVKAIYGEGLLEAVPLEMELEEVQERLRRLREAEARDGDNKRISGAIAAHERKADRLRGLLARQNRLTNG